MNNFSKVLFGNKDHTLLAVMPRLQLLKDSLYVVAGKQFNRWSMQNHTDSYLFMQRIAQAWKSQNFTDQYLIYGKVDSNPFHWEIVPYQKCRTCIGRIIQQLLVLWRTVFGGIAITAKESENQLNKQQLLLSKSSRTARPLPRNIHCKGNDSFCKNETIENQWVITGRKVNVLFNYAPIGFGGERLHFLVVSKEHRETFTDVTQEEYSECVELTTRLINHITETRKTVKNTYLLNKTGIDAGQTVKHWHLHVIFSNTMQDFWGKLTVFKNILLGSSPMKKCDLTKKVNELRKELAYLKSPPQKG